jgi:Flp pilus assembly protein CpaB
MNSRSIVVLLVAIGCGLAAAFFTSQMMIRDPLPPPAPATVELVEVVVARKDIPVGTFVQDPDELFKVVRYVKGDEPGFIVPERHLLKTRLVTRQIAEGQPIQAKDFAVEFDGIPAEHRLVSIRIDPVDAGMAVSAGMRVDVIGRAKLNGEYKSGIILEDILVVEMRKIEGGAAEKGQLAATLAVMPEQAVRLVAAEDQNVRFILALRPRPK